MTVMLSPDDPVLRRAAITYDRLDSLESVKRGTATPGDETGGAKPIRVERKTGALQEDESPQLAEVSLCSATRAGVSESSFWTAKELQAA